METEQEYLVESSNSTRKIVATLFMMMGYWTALLLLAIPKDIDALFYLPQAVGVSFACFISMLFAGISSECIVQRQRILLQPDQLLWLEKGFFKKRVQKFSAQWHDIAGVMIYKKSGGKPWKLVLRMASGKKRTFPLLVEVGMFSSAVSAHGIPVQVIERHRSIVPHMLIGFLVGYLSIAIANAIAVYLQNH